mmetsp:Transcript_37178/g.80937  ORF Transcript_37178/g.80937 Transcript_37178/m.80937 type:complete len:313 (-) Transcript_37178:109-1047(-)
MFDDTDYYPFEEDSARQAALQKLLSYRVPEANVVLDHSIIETGLRIARDAQQRGPGLPLKPLKSPLEMIEDGPTHVLHANVLKKPSVAKLAEKQWTSLLPLEASQGSVVQLEQATRWMRGEGSAPQDLQETTGEDVAGSARQLYVSHLPHYGVPAACRSNAATDSAAVASSSLSQQHQSAGQETEPETYVDKAFLLAVEKMKAKANPTGFSLTDREAALLEEQRSSELSTARAAPPWENWAAYEPPSQPPPIRAPEATSARARRLLLRARGGLLEPSVPWPVMLPAVGMALFTLYTLFGHLLFHTNKCITCI